MKPELLDQLVRAVLYEGYILYPYRPSSTKNCRERFTFGRVYPTVYSGSHNGAEPCFMQTECLARATSGGASLEVEIRFLQPTWREVGVLAEPLAAWREGVAPEYRLTPELMVNGTLHQSWQEAAEKQVQCPAISLSDRKGCSLDQPFEFPAHRTLEPLAERPDRIVGVLVRRREKLSGEAQISVTPLQEGVFRISARIWNDSPLPPEALANSDAVLMRTFASTHAVLKIQGGEFISQLDPPAELSEAASRCQNVGVWPVLVGDEQAGERDTMLSSPIILYDYPKIAAESRGDFFDATEIDEMLSLRVSAMTDDEKDRMRDVDKFARGILERVERMPAGELLGLHGAMRRSKEDIEEFFNPSQPLRRAVVQGTEVGAGDRVRLRPKGRADAFDMLLAGKTAMIEGVEQDAEGRMFLAVVLEDDPGRDLGLMRQPGHRFFYALNEVEPLPKETNSA